MKLGLKIFSAITASSILLGGVCVYDIYKNEKTEGTSQFSFPTNNISDSEIIMDGLKDDCYGDVLISFGKKTSGSFDVNVYSYATEQALYFFFDVYDENVTKRAIGNNNAQDEDGIEINIDRYLDGGVAAQKDDLRIYLGVSGLTKVLQGNGTKYDSMVGFGAELKSAFKDGTTVNDYKEKDTGYTLEYRIPYISLFGDANKSTPIALSFVQTTVDDITASRARTGMSSTSNSKIKVPSADVPDNYFILSNAHLLYSRTDFANLSTSFPTILGRISNINGVLISDAVVTGYYAKRPSVLYRTTTDSTGYFTYSDIEPASDFIVTIKKNGYNDLEVTYTLDNLNNAGGSEYYQALTLIPSSTELKTLTGKVNVMDNESPEGINVSLFGRNNIKTTTNADGEFSIQVYEGCDNKVIFSKKGYQSNIVDVKKDDTEIKEFELYKEGTLLAKPLLKQLDKNYVISKLSRCKEGLHLSLSSPYQITNKELFSLYINGAKTSSFDSDFADGDYRIDFVNNEATINEYKESLGKFVKTDTKCKVSSSLDVLYETSVIIPYSGFSFTKEETFGAASRFFNGYAYQNDEVDTNIAPDGMIDSLSTTTYLRFAYDNKVYFGNDNNLSSFLYYYHGIGGVVSEDIPNNADRIYMTYERDDTGLDMVITVDSGFGTHFNTSYKLSGAEAINFVLNIDGITGTSWALHKKDNVCYDINFRIYSDDTICYINSTDVMNQSANQLWWSDSNHNNGVAKNFTLKSKLVPSENYQIIKRKGSTVYKLHFDYGTLLELGRAPEDATLDGNSSISTVLFEISETSKTTVRFYTSSGDAWLYKNRALNKTIGAFSSQANYVSLPKNK